MTLRSVEQGSFRVTKTQPCFHSKQRFPWLTALSVEIAPVAHRSGLIVHNLRHCFNSSLKNAKIDRHDGRSIIYNNVEKQKAGTRDRGSRHGFPLCLIVEFAFGRISECDYRVYWDLLSNEIIISLIGIANVFFTAIEFGNPTEQNAHLFPFK